MRRVHKLVKFFPNFRYRMGNQSMNKSSYPKRFYWGSVSSYATSCLVVEVLDAKDMSTPNLRAKHDLSQRENFLKQHCIGHNCYERRQEKYVEKISSEPASAPQRIPRMLPSSPRKQFSILQGQGNGLALTLRTTWPFITKHVPSNDGLLATKSENIQKGCLPEDGKQSFHIWTLYEKKCKCKCKVRLCTAKI